MKKRLYFITTVLAAVGALSLSSCLKDSRYVNFAQSQPIVNFPLGGLQNFGADAIVESPDANGDIVRQFAVDIASPSIPTTATQVTLAIDNSLVDKYNSTETAVTYLPLPSADYSFTATSVTIPAGKRYATVSITFHKNLIDPTASFMLPIKIVSGTGAMVSGNYGIHYYHFIGNDFAGAYTQNFQRYNAGDSTSAALNGASFTGQPATILPVTPTEFQVATGYAGGVYIYDVTFTKTGTGPTATYSDFNVSFTDASVAAGTAGGISLTQSPVFFDPVTHKPATATLAGPYTLAEAKKIFHFQYKAHTSADRYLIDTFY